MPCDAASDRGASRSTDYTAPFLSRGLAVITTGFDNAWKLNTVITFIVFADKKFAQQ